MAEFARYLKDITDVTERPLDPVWASLLPQRRALGLVACPIASYCKLKQVQHQWNRRKFRRVLCSPSSNGSMSGPIKCLMAISSFCLGCPTQLWGTAGCNRSPALLSFRNGSVWAAPETDCACFILRLSWYSLASLKIIETSIKQVYRIPHYTTLNRKYNRALKAMQMPWACSSSAPVWQLLHVAQPVRDTYVAEGTSRQKTPKQCRREYKVAKDKPGPNHPNPTWYAARLTC